MVSVVIPTYNREKLLPKALNSVINQTYQNWELIIVDDNSTDNTAALVNSYSKKDKRIRYVRNDRRKGPSGARNCGLLQCSGEYIAFLDSDDEWMKHHLTDSMRVLLNEDVDVCFALWIEERSGNLVKFDTQEIQDKLNKALETLKPKTKDNLIFFGEGFYEFTILESFYCYHINTMVFKKSILDSVGLLDESLFANEDNDFTYKVFHDHEICLIMDYHFIYHQGQDNIYMFIDRSTADIEMIAENQMLIDKLTFNGNLENVMRMKRKKYVKISNKIKDKKACLAAIDKSIAEKYLTIGYIHRNKNKPKAFYYYLKALFYQVDKFTLLLMVKLLFPFILKNVKAVPGKLDIG